MSTANAHQHALFHYYLVLVSTNDESTTGRMHSTCSHLQETRSGLRLSGVGVQTGRCCVTDLKGKTLLPAKNSTFNANTGLQLSWQLLKPSLHNAPPTPAPSNMYKSHPPPNSSSTDHNCWRESRDNNSTLQLNKNTTHVATDTGSQLGSTAHCREHSRM